ncbi:LacI family DNA-binding transcriptional regulator [Nocardiopsis sp. NPDC006938]
MNDVARLAGVSHQTVSRVLNAHPGVLPETAARVRAAIAELGYRRNSSARALATHRSGLVGVLTTRPGHPDTARLLMGAERALRATGHTLLYTGTAPADLPAAAERLLGLAPEGCLALVPGQEDVLAALHHRPPTVVVHDDPRAPAHRLPSVGADHSGGARDLTRHLLGLGHRTVHHVADGSLGHAARTRGWRRALEEAGAPVPRPEHPDRTGAGAGRAAGLALAARRAGGEAVTAVLAADDRLALGLLRALEESGLRVPGQVSVAGFGDLPDAAHLTPALTTADGDPARVGEAAAGLLLRLLDGDVPDTGGPLLVPARARPRRSTGPPPRVDGPDGPARAHW